MMIMTEKHKKTHLISPCWCLIWSIIVKGNSFIRISHQLHVINFIIKFVTIKTIQTECLLFVCFL